MLTWFTIIENATVLKPNPNTYTNTEKSNLEKAILNLARDQILKKMLPIPVDIERWKNKRIV